MISVIIPIYNSEKYLRQCLNSIINQSYKDLQIILINDGSTDKSLEICEEYKLIDKRIIIINQDNAGAPASRNAGLKMASGEWISFVDSDDWLEITAYEKLIEIIQNNKQVELIHFNKTMVVNGDISPISNITSNRYVTSERKIANMQLAALYHEFDREFGVGTFFIWDKLYNNSIIKNNEMYFQETAYGQDDRFFNTWYFGLISKVYLSTECLYNYRIVEESLSHKYVPDRVKWDLGLYNGLIELKKNPNIKLSREFDQAVYCRVIENIWLCTYRCFFHPDNPDPLSKQLESVKEVLEDKVFVSTFASVNVDYLDLKLKIIVRCRKKREVVMYVLYKLAVLKRKISK